MLMIRMAKPVLKTDDMEDASGNRKRRFSVTDTWQPGAGLDPSPSKDDVCDPPNASGNRAKEIKQFFAKTSILFHELEDEVRRIFKARRLVDERERAESKRIATLFPIVLPCKLCNAGDGSQEQDPRCIAAVKCTCTQEAKATVPPRTPATVRRDNVTARPHVAPTSLALSTCRSKKTLISDFCNLDNFTVLSVAALALVGSAAAFMPTFSIDLGRRSFVHAGAASFMHGIPAGPAAIEKAKSSKAAAASLFEQQRGYDQITLDSDPALCAGAGACATAAAAAAVAAAVTESGSIEDDMCVKVQQSAALSPAADADAAHGLLQHFVGLKCRGADSDFAGPR